MFIRHIHIDNFGCFHNFDLELQNGLNIFSRPNEAGKTTLLEFIRRIFWGFPDKRRKQLNPYPALKGSGHYGGYLDVTMTDGRELRLERRGEKGKLKLIDPDGNVEETDDIASLAGVSENFYRNICAVTIDELTAFASVESDEIKNLIYGKAFSAGTVPLSEIQEHLSDEAELIFRKRGTNNLLKKLADDFSVSETRLAKVAGNMAAYEKAVLSAEKMESAAEKIKEEMDSLQQEITLVKKFLDHQEKRKRLTDEEKIFAARPKPEPLPEPMPPFGKSAPVPPPAPVFHEPVQLPPEPDHSHLASLCDVTRAVSISDNDMEEAAAWYAAVEKNQQKNKKVLVFLLFPVVISLLLITVEICGLLKSPAWLLSLGVPVLMIWVMWIRSSYSWQKEYGNLKKIREDLFFRFALNPALENSRIPGILKELQDLQQQKSIYDEAVQSFRIRNQQIETLRREYEMRRKLYDEACAVYTRERNEYDRKRTEFEKSYRFRSQAVAEYESEKIALERRIAEWENAGKNLVQPPHAGHEKLEELKQRYAELNRQREENLRFSGAERREAKILTDGVDSAVELNIREQLRGQMRTAAERYLMLRSAGAVLKKAIEKCEKERQPELLKNASEWFALFTCNAYTRVYKQLTTGDLRAGDLQSGTDKAVCELSRGTREQLFLALRLALITALENSAEVLPVIFDDILVDFDHDRRSAVMAGLEKFAASRQLLLFNCNSQ